MMNTRKKEVLTGVTIIALAAWLLVAVELSDRILNPGTQGQAEARRVTDRDYIDDDTGLRLFIPNRSYQRYRINNLGFRGPDIAEEKPPGRFRLAFLGTSTTLDQQTPEGENWPHRVTDRLRAAIEGCELDYVNAGVPRYSLGEIARLYEHRVAQTDPDLVIIMPGGVTQRLDVLARQQGFRRDPRNHDTQQGAYSYLMGEIETWRKVISQQTAVDSRSDKVRFDSKALALEYQQELQNLLEVINDEQRLIGVVSTVSKLSPELSAYELAQQSADLLNKRPYIHVPDLIELREVLNETSQETVSGYRAFPLPGLKDLPHDSNYFLGLVHFSPTGSEVMSQRIFEQLLSRQEVLSLLEKRGCSIVPGKVAAAGTAVWMKVKG
jgi:hypothetical protein